MKCKRCKKTLQSDLNSALGVDLKENQKYRRRPGTGFTKNQSSMTAKDTYSEQELKKNSKRKIFAYNPKVSKLSQVCRSLLLRKNGS